MLSSLVWRDRESYLAMRQRTLHLLLLDDCLIFLCFFSSLLQLHDVERSQRESSCARRTGWKISFKTRTPPSSLGHGEEGAPTVYKNIYPSSLHLHICTPYMLVNMDLSALGKRWTSTSSDRRITTGLRAWSDWVERRFWTNRSTWTIRGIWCCWTPRSYGFTWTKRCWGTCRRQRGSWTAWTNGSARPERRSWSKRIVRCTRSGWYSWSQWWRRTTRWVQCRGCRHTSLCSVKMEFCTFRA